MKVRWEALAAKGCFMTIESEYRQVLQEFCQKNEHVVCALLTSKEGSVISSVVDDTYDLETIGTISCSTIQIVEEIIADLKRKGLHRLSIKGRDGIVFLRSIDNRLILTVLANHGIPLDVLHRETENASEKIMDMLGKEAGIVG